MGIMRSFGQVFSIVEVQLPNLVQKLNEEGALTRSDGLSSNLADLDELDI